MRSVILIAILLSTAACKTSNTAKTSDSEKISSALFTINGEPTFPGEFKYAYNKSSKNKGTEEEIEEYLELYINFKLKVLAARKLGLDTLPSYKKELQTYLKDIKKPYLVSEQVKEELIQETYDRLQQEVKASHILIRLEENASPEDSLQAYKKIEDIKRKFEDGESFKELAKKYSEDPSAKDNLGSLGWFTAFQMVYPFESAAYQTEKGQISDIIRTQFGYHLIYVQDKRETSGRIKIAHIMKRFPVNGSLSDSLMVKKEIYDIHNQLIEGQSWFAMATKYSEDLNTKDQGGVLPWFGVGGLPKPMEAAAFKLEQKDQISSPVKSPYGWHIIKLEEKRGMGSLESMKESLKRRIQRDQRAELKVSEVIATLKQDNNFKRNQELYTKFRTIKEIHPQKIDDKLKAETIFSIQNEKYSVNSFLQSLDGPTKFSEAIEDFESTSILAYEDAHLSEKYPEYRYLASEYTEGLLLFEIMGQKVWNKIATDSVEMRSFYKTNLLKYKTDTLLRAKILILTDSSSINIRHETIDSLFLAKTITVDSIKSQSIDLLLEKTKPILRLSVPEGSSANTLTEIKQQINSKFPDLLFMEPIYSKENKIYLQLFYPANKYLANLNNGIISAEQGIYPVSILGGEKAKSLNSGIVINDKINGDKRKIYIDEILLPKVKTYKEAKAEVIADYQEYLEKQWIEQLKGENTVKIDQEVFQKTKEEIAK